MGNRESSLQRNVLVAPDPESEGGRFGLAGDPGSISIHNINSYMGGRLRISDLGKTCGLVESTTGSTPQLGHKLFNKVESSHEDKQLEFFAWKNLLHMGLKNGKKIAQSTGPFEIKFKEHFGTGGKNFAYFQVDGEYYQFKNPDKLVIRLTTKVQEGSLRILVRGPAR